MRILFLSSRLPHASVAGGHTIVHQRMMRLAKRGHEIGLASFCANGKHAMGESLRDFLFEMELLDTPAPASLVSGLAHYLFWKVPAWYWTVRSESMQRTVGEMVERSRYDVVIAEFSLMGQYLYCNPYLPAVRRVVSVHHSATLLALKRIELLGPSVAAGGEWLQMKGLRDFEFSMYRSADQVLVLTPQERYWLLNQAPDLRIAVVPSGVDVTYFKPREHESSDACILFTGNYMDQPNRDAVIWFARKMWPEIRSRHPELMFYVVGPEPTDEMRELAIKDSRIIVTGWVEDLRPYFAKAEVFICPVRMGKGMRGKILEAMAMGVPVVSTMLGVEGIPAQMGDNCFIADQPRTMIQQIELLLSDPTLRSSVAQRARDMVTKRFSWEHSVDQLEAILQELPHRR